MHSAAGLQSDEDLYRQSGSHGMLPAKVRRLYMDCCCTNSAPILAGYTPLHMASGYLHTPVVELLSAYGADPEVWVSMS